VDERGTAWLEQVQDAYEHRRTLQSAGARNLRRDLVLSRPRTFTWTKRRGSAIGVIGRQLRSLRPMGWTLALVLSHGSMRSEIPARRW
jgi:hypothetical protein